MSALATLLDEQPSVTWHEEPRDKLRHSEEYRQREFLRLIPFVAPGLMAFAIPNAGRRTQWEARKAKLDGMRAGVADLHVIWNHGSAWLEFKDGSSKASDAQMDFLAALTRMGHRVAVVRTAVGAFRWLHEVGAPVRLNALEALRP